MTYSKQIPARGYMKEALRYITEMAGRLKNSDLDSFDLTTDDVALKSVVVINGQVFAKVVIENHSFDCPVDGDLDESLDEQVCLHVASKINVAGKQHLQEVIEIYMLSASMFARCQQD